MGTTLDDLARAGLTPEKLATILVQQIIITGGELNLDQRNISNSFNNSEFRGNLNAQGDQVEQKYTETNGISEEALAAFLSEIKKLPEGQEKTDAISDFQNLQEAVKKSNWERAKGIFKLFSETLRTSAAGVTVAKVIGLLPPLP
ncbi:hypothetical protein [Brevibacillus fulvus]|uniref:hypothetical protein n=1 Tax=Brevibacillus fulvus TaxID=1125967 RepID=UPI001959E270|nr:hypothetical protein [Brevibacillus fulvus]